MRFVLLRGVPLLASVLLLNGCDSPSAPVSATPLGIVLLVGDGMGEGAIDAARIAFGPLAIESLPRRSLVVTSSASDSVTDSGAAATALASGVLTLNGGIGVDPDLVPVETILEAAERRGMATGLIVTSAVTHATPAAFAAHVPTRENQHGIALQMALSGVDVLLGGGRRFFDPQVRSDGLDLLEWFRRNGCAVHDSPADLSSPDTTTTCLVGLFAPDRLAPAGEREADLARLTDIGLEILTRDADGFFLMVEGSHIDFAAHANDGPYLLSEMEAFDAAVAVVLERLMLRPNTLIVVAADHETGGLTATPGGAPGAVSFTWGTTAHTAALVPLYAAGPGADGLGTQISIDSVGRFMLQRLRER